MEFILAKKVEELSLVELISVLRQLLTQDKDAFNTLKELVDETL